MGLPVASDKGRILVIEFLFEKKTGNTTGWIAYTLSKNMRKFEGINDGNWFPFKYDRRHEFRIVLCHRFNDRVNVAADWVFMSGRAATLARYKYLIDTQQLYGEDDVYGSFGEAYYYNGLNSFRTPPYHRLDVTVNFVKHHEKGIATWSLGLYNAYNHYNPYYLYFARNASGETKLYSLSLFPILPSISYNYTF